MNHPNLLPFHFMSIIIFDAFFAKFHSFSYLQGIYYLRAHKIKECAMIFVCIWLTKISKQKLKSLQFSKLFVWEDWINTLHMMMICLSKNVTGRVYLHINTRACVLQLSVQQKHFYFEQQHEIGSLWIFLLHNRIFHLHQR